MTKAAELAKMGEVLTNSQIGGRRNIVINGACQVAQRGTSSTGLGGSAPGYTTVDRWQLSVGATSAGRFSTAQVSVTDLPGFANAFHLDCTTADTSIAAGEVLKMDYKIEGQDLQQLKKGTSSAEKVTVSFYMKTNKAFTFMCELDDRDNNRRNGQQFTTTTDWTRHVLTFAGDTTGTLDDDTALSMVISFFFHAGSDFTGGTYSANTWESRASSDNMRAVGIGSFFDSTDNDIKITGLQMEVGEQATPFEHRSFGEELALCERYFQLFTHNGSDGGNITNGMISSDRFFGVLQFKKDMRAIPTITSTSSGFNVSSSAHTVGSMSIDETHNTTIHAARLRTGSDSSFTDGQGAVFRYDGGSINIDAEL
jgi:hypothetical protein